MERRLSFGASFIGRYKPPRGATFHKFKHVVVAI